jgi:hypothetical protein
MTSSNMNKANDFRRAPQSLRGPSLLKRAAILSGFYPEIRKIHRILSPERGSSFNAEVAFFRRFIQPGDLCFDVGANVGGKSEAMLRAGARVVAFEPQPFQVREITARCRRYGGRLTVIESAVGEKSGKAVLHLRRSSVQSSLLSNMGRRASWRDRGKGHDA